MTENSEEKQHKRPGHRFQKGQSGNPAGKPVGTRHATTLAVEALLRVAPVRRGRPVVFELPPLDKAGDLGPALAGILSATASGDLTPEEAATIAGLLEAKRKALETGELEQRLEQLEQRLAVGGIR